MTWRTRGIFEGFYHEVIECLKKLKSSQEVESFVVQFKQSLLFFSWNFSHCCNKEITSEATYGAIQITKC